MFISRYTWAYSQESQASLDTTLDVNPLEILSSPGLAIALLIGLILFTVFHLYIEEKTAAARAAKDHVYWSRVARNVEAGRRDFKATA